MFREFNWILNIIRFRSASLFLLGQLIALSIYAQDTTNVQTIKIISEYKPVLRSGTKLFFSASPLPSTSFPYKFSYVLPDQQFRVMMKPAIPVPSTYSSDSMKFINHHFVKLGMGNFQRIYADAGTAWGTGKQVQLQLMVGHHSLSGDLNFQGNSRTYAEAFLQAFKRNHQLNATTSFSQSNFYLYANDSTNVGAKIDSLRLTYNRFGFEVDLSNNEPNVYGIKYRPGIRLNYLGSVSSNEWNALFRLPVSYKVNDQLEFSAQINADITSFKSINKVSYTNNIISFTPAFHFPYRDMRFDLGSQLAWDQGNLNFLPQLGMEAFVRSNRAIVLGGWKSSIRKNNYLQLIDVNPWIRQPVSQFNTRVDELFAGLRGDLPLNLNYRFRAGITNFHSLPLFVNLLKPSVFDVIYEGSLQTFHVQGSVEWLRSEQLTVTGGIEVYRVINQQDSDKPWHFIPTEISLSTTWRPVKHLMIKGKLFGWQGAYALIDINGANKRLPAVVDANIDADLRIGKWVSAWVQINNMFNQSYERWYLYPVVGIQLVGGIRLNFENHK